MDHAEALRRILREERGVFGTEVLAPVHRGGKLRVRIGDLVWECALDGGFSGWGVFRILDGWKAELVRPAEIWERDEYAARLQKSALVLVFHDSSGVWWGRTFRSSSLFPVFLAEGVQLFDHVTTCFDGSCRWYLGPEPRFDARKAAALRACIEDDTPADEMRVAGLTKKERDLYAAALDLARAFADRRKPPEVRRVERALKLGDAELLDYAEVSGGYRVRWRKGETVLTSILDRNLSVVSAGLCLSGRDREHDITSLASLMAEYRGPQPGMPGC